MLPIGIAVSAFVGMLGKEDVPGECVDKVEYVQHQACHCPLFGAPQGARGDGRVPTFARVAAMLGRAAEWIDGDSRLDDCRNAYEPERPKDPEAVVRESHLRPEVAQPDLALARIAHRQHGRGARHVSTGSRNSARCTELLVIRNHVTARLGKVML